MSEELTPPRHQANRRDLPQASFPSSRPGSSADLPADFLSDPPREQQWNHGFGTVCYHGATFAKAVSLSRSQPGCSPESPGIMLYAYSQENLRRLGTTILPRDALRYSQQDEYRKESAGVALTGVT